MTAGAVTRSRLWLALRFGDLPLNALGLTSEASQAVAIVEKQRIVCVNAQAQAVGIQRGMDTTKAQLLGDCDFQLRDRAREQQSLAQLAERLYRFTPYIETHLSATQAEAGLLLEVSRCLKLFAGIAPLAKLVFTDLGATLYRFDYGLAHSAKGAWLLSYRRYVIDGGEDRAIFYQRLQQVPIDWLHDYPQVADALVKTGFRTLGDLAKQIDEQSISSIKKRFGAAFAAYICDVFAIEQNFSQASLFDKPAKLYQPQEFFLERIEFDYPIRLLDQLSEPMQIMLQKLGDYLRKRQWQCQQIEWRLYDIQRNSECLPVCCDTAQSGWHLLHELTLIQLERKPLPFEVDSIELACRNTTPVQSGSMTLALDQHTSHHKRESTTHNFALTAAKLKARLGDAALYKVGYSDSLAPEESNACLPLNQAPDDKLPKAHRHALRPHWLFDTPLPIEERLRGLYWRGYLTLLAGPERIEGNWWHKPTARDYFLARRQDHLRVWIYKDLYQQRWYVQGVFS